MSVASAFFDVASLALDCICTQMDLLSGDDAAPEGYGCPCLAYVSAGEPAVDCCTVECEPGGMLAVHVADIYPSDTFPVRTSGFEPCRAATWVAEIVVTAARCARSMDDEGNLVPVDELTGQAELMAFDSYAILTALGCCLVAESVAGKRRRRVFITGSRPQVSEGGCASVEVRALVEAGNVCNCPPAAS